MQKKLTLCADDFGFNSSINQGILNLIDRGKLSATSCMTTLPLWPEAGAELKKRHSKVECGLHFNLTENTGVSLSTLMRKAFLHQLNPADLISELKHQIEAFKTVMGHVPDFIDGHQHVHQLPQIRDALLKVYAEYYPEKTAWIRVSSQPQFWKNFKSIKHLIIAMSGGLSLRKALLKNNIPHNTSFSGIYPFDPKSDYAALLKSFIKESQDGGLIMCHPGLASTDVTDPIYQTRGLEYQVLLTIHRSYLAVHPLTLF
ncbi:MAG: ChbG/HpnK family deacetylase [Gammaproteobacteria bacterium]|nr:ChbG/HpnK family deacetylase [Gammaproteobacteria bacterium]